MIALNSCTLRILCDLRAALCVLCGKKYRDHKAHKENTAQRTQRKTLPSKLSPDMQNQTDPIRPRHFTMSGFDPQTKIGADIKTFKMGIYGCVHNI